MGNIDQNNSANERPVDSMAKSVKNLLQEVRHAVGGLVRNVLTASLLFAACGYSDTDIDSASASASEWFLNSEQLTDREHGRIQREIEQIRLSMQVFSFMAPALDPLFNAQGEALDEDDANYSVIADMEVAVDNLQILLDGERILKIRVENLPEIDKNSAALGQAFGVYTQDHEDDYISLVTFPTVGVVRLWLEKYKGILMHESAHYSFGGHSAKVNEARKMYVSNEISNEEWVAIVMEDRDFPYLMSFIMDSGIGDILKVQVPSQQQINTFLGQGYDLVTAVNVVHQRLLDMVRPFDEQITGFIFHAIQQVPKKSILRIAGLTPQEARDALEKVRPEYEAQADLVMEELRSMEDKYGRYIDNNRLEDAKIAADFSL